MTTPPLLLRLLGALAWICLLLGLAAVTFSLQTAAGREYAPLAPAVLGLLSLAVGYLLGRAVRPLGRWRPPVPLSSDGDAPPTEGLGLLWVRGFAAGFWALVALTLAITLLYDLLFRLSAAIPGLLPATQLLLLASVLVLCGITPLAVARGMVAVGEGLPQGTLATIAGAACVGELALLVAALPLVAALGPFNAGSIGSLAALLALPAVPIIALGTPVLAQSLRPSLNGPAWTALLALASLAGAWLLYGCLERWIGLFGSITALVWLLLGCLLWGGSLGGLLAAAAVQRRVRRGRAAVAGTQGVSLIALTAGGLGLFLLLSLIPVASWLFFAFSPRPAVAPMPAPVNPMPTPTQPGTLRIPGPPLAAPAAGSTVTGPTWRFRWNPSPGATPGDLYQFTFWPPGAAMSPTQIVTPGTVVQVGAAPDLANQKPGPWAWRVRLMRPGQGAGQWSETRTFTPVWR